MYKVVIKDNSQSWAASLDRNFESPVCLCVCVCVCVCVLGRFRKVYFEFALINY